MYRVGESLTLVNGGGVELLGKQLVAVAATLAFSGIMTLIIAKIVDATVGLRVTPDDEAAGLDTTQHAETGYNLTELGSMGRTS